MSSPRALSLGGFVGVQREVGGDFRVIPRLSGWGDSPSVRSSFEDRAGQDGVWDNPGHFGARVVGIEGFVSQVSHAAALAVRDELTALHPLVQHELIVDDGSVRSAIVRVTRGAVVSWVNDVAFRWEMEVTAPDMILYGPPQFTQIGLAASAGGAGRVWPRVWPRDWGVPPGVTPGAVSLANAGTASYWPRLRIDGPVTNPTVTLTETGDWVRIERQVLAGQWLDIDLGARRVLLNGQVSVMDKVTFSGAWLAVPPGGASLSWTSETSDPAALLSVWSYESAWN